MLNAYYVIAAASLAALLIIAGTLLRMWQSWLVVRLRELDGNMVKSGTTPITPGHGSMSGLIELADLKERIRKLEAIAAGIDL